MASIRTRIGPVDDPRKVTLEEILESEQLLGYRYEQVQGSPGSRR